MGESIKLSFVYSKELEVDRILNTINRLDWYLKNKYDINSLSFPKNFNKSGLANISKEDIFNAVEAEYDQNKYISAAESIKQLYSVYELRLRKFLKDVHLAIIPNIIVNLTIYGMAGSYSLPNKVIVNISKFYSLGLLKNIFHEIIHLHIQHLIDKYRIDQWEKEVVVNLLFKTAFLDLYKENKIPMDTKEIEAVYKANFPDIKKIISLI